MRPLRSRLNCDGDLAALTQRAGRKLTGQIDQFGVTEVISRRRRDFAEDIAPFDRGDLIKVQASVAKMHFSQLLDEVERGRTIVILRHGPPLPVLRPTTMRGCSDTGMR